MAGVQVGGQGRPAVVGELAHRVRQRLQEAGMDGREALTELGMADHMAPELEEDRQPAVVAVATLGRRRRQPVERLFRAGLAQARDHLGQRLFDPPLIDREEQVLLGEVGVDGPLGVGQMTGDPADSNCRCGA